MNLNRLLLIGIGGPSLFVVAVSLGSFLPHEFGLLNHTQEHAALAVIMIAGIIPFSLLMVRLFRRMQAHVLRQNEELGRRSRETEALLQVGRAAEESLELDRVLPAALDAVLEATSAEAAEVWLLEPKRQEVVQRCHRGAAPEAFFEVTAFPVGKGCAGLVVHTGTPMLVHDLPGDPRFIRERVKDAGFHTFYAMPLRRGGGTIGALTVASRDATALTDAGELRLLDLMADRIATAAENARLHEEVHTLAILTERERIAREMHDGLGQVLGYVNTKAQAVKELLRGGEVEEAARHMGQLEAAAQETYDDVRQAILALSANGKRPLLESLREYVARFSDLAGLPTDLTVDGDPHPLNPGMEVQVLRIVQEALANTRKHAQAGRAAVSLAFCPEGWRVVVEDDGRGFNPEHLDPGPWPHLGLQSMRERASAIGGRFTLDTAPGNGTRVILDIPRAGA